MNLRSSYRINKSKITYKIFPDGNLIIVNFDAGAYYSVNITGGQVWSLLESGASLDEIIDAAAARYAQERLNVEKTVTQFIIELENEYLILPEEEKNAGIIKNATAQVSFNKGVKESGFEAPVLRKYTDMEDMLRLDPIHEVDETGWPNVKPDSSA